ncbi:hypothetical protein AHF37_05235 [Paragonimus kellicotti]|nr:hypothetical protein AHF37_05235 [Paragonimus kellicotti]
MCELWQQEQAGELTLIFKWNCHKLLNLLIETTKLLPSDEERRLLSVHQVELMMQTKPKGTLGLPSEPSGLSLLTRFMYYLIADHFMKNNSFDSWTRLAGQPTCYVPHLVSDDQSLIAIAQMPLRTELLEEINGDSDVESDNNRHQPPACGPSIGEACHIVTAVLEFFGVAPQEER